MATLSTHVLDTEQGEPARGVLVTLARRDGDTLTVLDSQRTNQDGRIGHLGGPDLPLGQYQISFDVAAYFSNQGRVSDFLTEVIIGFQITQTRHYHVPLLASRYACSSYRGS